ncbi:MAG: carbon monoxide dehydrogenase beta subunit family protein [Candidatus Hodarchaeales archaeon]|jgi:CO dehydrogenase/acetyl-CoA synthase complex epsilon subunit
MSHSNTPWQIGNVPGPTVARTLEPSTFTRLMKKQSVFVVGIKVGEEGEEGEFLRTITKVLDSKGIPIIASPSSERILREELGVSAKLAINLPVLSKKLTMEDWDNLGFEAENIVISGFYYYYQSQAFAAIRNNNEKLRTISLEPYYSPNATYSSPTIAKKKLSEWYGEMIAAAEKI